MALVEGTGGAVNGTGWKNQTKNQNKNKTQTQTTTASASTAATGTGIDLSLLQSIYAQQQAAAAEAERQRREAAQRAYDRSMAALNAAYSGQIEALKNNYNSTLGQLQSDYDQGAAGVDRNADSALQQAYINQMMTLKNLPQQLSAQGISGGAAETTLAGVYNNYGNSRNEINTARGQNLAELMTQLNAGKSQAQQAYNSQLSDAQATRLAYEMQLEQNLSNAVADAAAVNYDRQFDISSEYLTQVAKLQSEMASAARKASQSTISASNTQQTKSAQQSDLLEQVWRSAWNNAKNAGGSQADAVQAANAAAAQYIVEGVGSKLFTKSEANGWLKEILQNLT
ncbi:MAG TPA: hypothetical protein H9773_10410 [Candidatus Fournierella merdavium]|uniref:hypothetical protein n=1 Tax=Candidatus Allofournierella merdavium TaxID=2838593 RepID=UPI001FA68A44|nr:hypothetical protein [Candidatus Fournierella merdavium]